MTYEQFWYGEPQMASAYRKAHDLLMEERNQQMYMQGAYNFHAITTALSNIHLDGKHHKINQYLDKPFEIRPKTEIEKEIEGEKQKENVISALTRWAKNWKTTKGMN